MHSRRVYTAEVIMRIPFHWFEIRVERRVLGLRPWSRTSGPGVLGHIFFGLCGLRAMCTLTTLYHCVTLHATCGRVSEEC